MTLRLPIEIIEHVLLALARWANRPKLAFQLATLLRSQSVQSSLIHSIITVDDASARGFVKALDLLQSSPEGISASSYTDCAMDNASGNGHIRVLAWWISSGLKLKYSEIVWTLASANGHVEVLDWWWARGELGNGVSSFDLGVPSSAGHAGALEWWKSKACKVDLKYGRSVMDDASANGHVGVLEWWKASGFTVQWTERALIRASANGHVKVLEWWKRSGLDLRLKWYTDAMDEASANGHTGVLDWWNQSGFERKYTFKAINNASKNRHVNVLDWWINSDLELKYTEWALIHAISNADMNVLSWWSASGLKLKLPTEYDIHYDLRTVVEDFSRDGKADVLRWLDANTEMIMYGWTNKAIDNASMNGHVDVLQFWKSCGLAVCYSTDAIDKASAEGHMRSLEWWRRSGLEMKYTFNSILWAVKKCHVDILWWWVESGLDLRGSKHGFDRAGELGHEDVIRWWEAYGDGVGLPYRDRGVSLTGSIKSECSVDNLREQ
ncbi:hypothetical protein BJ742DRAFT_265980 [Cladochytrium replicatum]|nr:hypothetical protein BJ742DRAFT_265980 [Cladochytrium replicatum]